MEKKICAGCGLDLPLEKFYSLNIKNPKKNKYGQGVKGRCIECYAIVAHKRYLNNKKEILTKNAKWKKKNPDKVAKYYARYWIRRYMCEAAKKEIGQALGLDFSKILK